MANPNDVTTTYSPGAVNVLANSPFGGGGGNNGGNFLAQLEAMMNFRRRQEALDKPQINALGRSTTRPNGQQRRIKDANYAPQMDPGELMGTSYTYIPNGNNGPSSAVPGTPGSVAGGYRPRGSGPQQANFGGMLPPSTASFTHPANMEAERQAAILDQPQGAPPDWYDQPEWMRRQYLSKSIGGVEPYKLDESVGMRGYAPRGGK